MPEQRELVVPGDLLDDSGKLRPGPNTYREKGAIYAARLGLKDVRGDTITVLGLSGRYDPQRGDMVIGTVVEVGPSNWYINIGAAGDVGMHVNDVPWRVDFGETSKYLKAGDAVLLKINHVDELKKVQVSMKDRQARKLTGGLLLDVTPTKVARIIGRSGSMITMVKGLTNTRMFVGQNGVIWIDGDSKDVALAIEGIRKIEDLSHTSGLTETVRTWLRSMGATGEERPDADEERAWGGREDTPARPDEPAAAPEIAEAPRERAPFRDRREGAFREDSRDRTPREGGFRERREGGFPERRDERPREGGAGGERPRPGGSREDRPREGGFGDDRPREGGVRERRDDRPREAFRDDRPRQGGFREERPREGGPREERPREGGFREERPREGGPREERPREGGFREERPREGGFREERPREGGFRAERPREGGFGEGRPREGASREERPREGGFRENRPREAFGADRPREGGFGERREERPRFGDAPAAPAAPRGFDNGDDDGPADDSRPTTSGGEAPEGGARDGGDGRRRRRRGGRGRGGRGRTGESEGTSGGSARRDFKDE